MHVACTSVAVRFCDPFGLCTPPPFHVLWGWLVLSDYIYECQLGTWHAFPLIAFPAPSPPQSKWQSFIYADTLSLRSLYVHLCHPLPIEVAGEHN